jgi:(R,R)-butanediol dehydrogenase / meso-butanediol dehydrogenase / diacetyl reductase
MRACLYYGPGDLRVEDVPEPSPGPGQVKVKVAYNGICGSDLHEYYDGPMMTPAAGPHPLTGAQLPVILGHEAAGTVVEVGPGTKGIAEGDLVAIEPIVACGTCLDCVSGAYNHCPRHAFHGYSTAGGGLSEYTVVAAPMAHVVPAGMSARQAALVEPMAVAYHAVRRAQVSEGDLCVVFGAGPIGLGAMFALHALGVTSVVVEPSSERRAVAQKLGAAHVLDPAEGDVAALVKDLADGRGAAACIDAAAVPGTLADSLRSIRTEGRVVLVGVSTGPVPLVSGLMFKTEATITASTAYCGDFPAVIEAMRQGHYPLDGWVSVIGLDRVLPDGFDALRAGRATKILVVPS